jgi:hypothetical protein
MRTPGCFVASISDELYGPILDAVPSQPSPTNNLERIQRFNHPPTEASSIFNTGWDIPLRLLLSNPNRESVRIFNIAARTP